MKLLIGIAILALVILILTGCGGSGGETPTCPECGCETCPEVVEPTPEPAYPESGSAPLDSGWLDIGPGGWVDPIPPRYMGGDKRRGVMDIKVLKVIDQDDGSVVIEVEMDMDAIRVFVERGFVCMLGESLGVTDE